MKNSDGIDGFQIDYSDSDKEPDKGADTKTQFRWRIYRELRRLRLLQENLEVDVARTTKKIKACKRQRVEIEERIR